MLSESLSFPFCPFAMGCFNKRGWMLMFDRKNLYVGGTLRLNGNLHVRGEFEAKGTVWLKKGCELVIDGKRTIHGSVKEAKD